MRLIACYILCASLGASAWAAAPNVLLIVSEDNGQELGCYGDPYAQTPVLDRLAAEGVLFKNAYVPQAGCSQSRAAYLTGLYPHQNGQIGLATWKFSMYRKDTPNMASLLKAAGFRTGILGKLHVNPEEAFPFDMEKISKSNFNRNDLKLYAEEAAAFFGQDDRPFFLSVNYPDAHRPFIKEVGGLPEKPLTGADVKALAYFGLDSPELRQDVADYYNCMSRLDSMIGDLLDELEASGRADNTLVVYIGDHGADLLRGKRTSYEGGLRVPMIVRWPAGMKPGQVRTELVSTLDLLPTFCEATGVRAPANLPGRSLAPLLRGETPDWRELLFTEFHIHSGHNFYPQRTVRNGRFKLIENLMPGEVNPGYDFTLLRFFPGLPDRIERAPEPVRSAYLGMRAPVRYELYDLKNDPFEFENLADDPKHRKILAELSTALARWRRQTNDPLLDESNLRRLKAEVDACLDSEGAPDKAKLNLTYGEYFFDK
ncbi:MAG: sulfatase family protein [Planctomycetota bacterium]